MLRPARPGPRRGPGDPRGRPDHLAGGNRGRHL